MYKLSISLLCSVALVISAVPAQAQTTPGIANVVASCGTPNSTYTANQNRPLTMDTTGKICTSSSGGGGGGEVDLTGINGNTPLTGAGLTGNGSFRVTEAAASPTSSSALAANAVICGAACQITSFNVSADSTLSGAAWWIMIYNATAAPSDGSVTPAKCYAMPSGSTGIAAAFPVPLNLSTGAVIGVSTTGCFTKTASTHAFISGDAR